jgi:hypothetical protein
MPIPTSSPEVLARRTGPCPYDCGEPIVKGESYIRKVDGKGWMHGRCAADYEDKRSLFEELNREEG